MRFIEPGRRLASAAGAALAAVSAFVAGCASRPASPPAPEPASPTAAPAPATAGVARDWDEYRRRAAEKLVAANPERTYLGAVPEPLLAIPVLEIELERDGSVRHIGVLRVPSQAKDTTQLAIDAVRRAAPFGDVSALPKPWRFAEVFLFDDERRFKPRTLD